MAGCPIDHPFKNILCEVPVDDNGRHSGDHKGSYLLDYEEDGEVKEKIVIEDWPNFK